MYYLVERLSLDPYENRFHTAMTWEFVGITKDIDVAKHVVNSSKVYDKNECWCLDGPTQSMRYTLIKSLDNETV